MNRKGYLIFAGAVLLVVFCGHALGSGSFTVKEGVAREDYIGEELPVLNIACMTGNVAAVEMALARGADLESTDAEGYTPLHCALENGHTEIAKVLISHGASLKARTRNGLTTLHFAAASGNIELAQIFLRQGVDINAEEAESGSTPVSCAALNGRLEMVKLLLASGATVKSGCCKAPLTNAALGHQGLLNLNAQVNAGRPRMPPGTEADYVAVAELLIGKGADVNAKCPHGSSPLANALGNGFHAMTDLLVEKGAQLSLERFGQDTLLHFACAGGNKKVAENLLSKGAEVDARGKNDYTPLHYAADCGRPAVAELLLEHQAALDTRTRDGRTALHLAAQGHFGGLVGPPPDADYAAVAELLIRRGVDVRAVVAETGAQPLHVAAASGNTPVARTLLDKGAPVDGLDHSGNTPLFIALMCCREDVVGLLLARGANPKARNREGATALHVAAVSGSRELVRSFIALGLDMEDTGQTCEATPLCNAALYGRPEVVRYLLEKGAKVEPETLAAPLICAAVGSQRVTPQSKAQATSWSLPGSDAAYMKVAELLIAKGANVNTKAQDGHTALDLALINGLSGMADLLIQNKADINVRHAGGRTLLHEACSDGNMQLAERLLSKGADIEAQDDSGFAPLLTAVDLGRPAMVELLLKHQAAVRAKPSDGRTSLHIAAQGRLKNTPHGPVPDSDYAAVARTLIRSGADVGAVSERTGLQPLHVAAWSGNKSVARVLLDNGAPVDPLDQAGDTPLSLAVHYSNPAIVELLLVHKANANHKNNDGLSVLDLARSQKNMEIEEMLRRHGAGGGSLLGDESDGPNTANGSAGKALHRVDPVTAAERSLREAENNLTPDHPEVAACLCRLADAYAAQGQNPLAATMYRRALSIREKALGPDHADVAEVLEKLAAVYRKIGSWKKQAEALEKRAAAIRAVKP